MMKYIRITKGFKSLVDNEDYEKFNAFKWQVGSDGKYAQRTITSKNKRVSIFLHRAIMNTPKGKDIDHKNGNTLDNRKSNLRISTRSQNILNPNNKVQKSFSGYRGVSLSGGLKNKWRARIFVKGKEILLGRFKTKSEAIRIRNEANKLYAN